MKTSEVLNTAADLIEQRGWTRGQGWPGLGEGDANGLCLEGGIMAALGVTGYAGHSAMYSCPAYSAVRSYLGDQAPFIWNDKQGYERGTWGLTWAGGSKESSLEAGKARVIETLRACALIESSREEQDAAFDTYAVNVAVSA